MPRKGLRPRDRRPLPPPDFKYNSVMVSRFINKLNFQGQRLSAQRLVYDALEAVGAKSGEEPVAILTRAVENARPLLEVRPRRVGGATYQVPVDVRPMRSSTVAMRWLIDAARNRMGRPMAQRLAEEILLASKKEGSVFKKREDTHKMAEANRAFAHYRW
jgi:small subunit ribosomal protein S7